MNGYHNFDENKVKLILTTTHFVSDWGLLQSSEIMSHTAKPAAICTYSILSVCAPQMSFHILSAKIYIFTLLHCSSTQV